MNSGMYYGRLYFLQGMRLLWRNRFWSAITGIIISLLLFVVYVMVATAAHTHQAAEKVQDQLVVTAILKQDSTSYRSIVPASSLASQIRQMPEVKSVHVVSEQEARSRFLRNIKDLKAAPAAWVFSEALEIGVRNPADMAKVRDQVLKMQGIEQATYLEALVKRLTAVSDYLRRMAFIGALLLTLIAVMVVMAVVRTAIHSEQHTVATMSSVGGSLWTIQAPLLVQMLSVTLAASLIACLAGWWIDPKIGSSFGQNISNLPSWLLTKRSYGLLTLWPVFAAGAGAAVSSIVCYGTWRYTRPARTH